MIRISRLTDYGIVLMTYVAANPERMHNAAEIATDARLPLATVSKLLRVLAREELLASHRGVKGGYSLARSAKEISVAEIICALEGPLALTRCSTGHEGDCAYEVRCPVSGHWQQINRAIRQALESVTLAEMTGPPARHAAPLPFLAANAAHASQLAHR
jgi:FeS assembly SUF system regulator